MNKQKINDIKERIVWWMLVKLLRKWSNKYMDQFTMVQFVSPYGPVYVNIGRSTPYPDSFEKIYVNGNYVNIQKPTDTEKR